MRNPFLKLREDSRGTTLPRRRSAMIEHPNTMLPSEARAGAYEALVRRGVTRPGRSIGDTSLSRGTWCCLSIARLLP